MQLRGLHLSTCLKAERVGYDNPNLLPWPEGFEPGFESQAEKEQLARWLLQHHQRISIQSWLSWVDHLGLLSLPGIGNRIRRRIRLGLDAIAERSSNLF